MFDVPLHILIVHFPIALTLVALAYDGWGEYSSRPELHATGYGLTLWAAAGAALAVATGLGMMGGVGFDNPRTTAHAAAGLVAGISVIGLALARYAAKARQHPAEYYPASWRFLEIFAAAAIAVAAITGHKVLQN